MVIFLQERVSIKTNGFLRNSPYAEKISHGLGHQKHDLVEHTIRRGGNFKLRKQKRTIVGRMYVRAPVSSNMMTTTVTVIRITPLRH